MKHKHAPNHRLRSLGTSTRACVDRIERTYHRATPTQCEAGARWYDQGEMFVHDLALSTDHSIEHTAAVVAHLSPRTPWSRNMFGATMLLTTGEAPTCLGANVRRARAALEHPKPLDTLKGPKTARFARNLLGDREVVTVDVWAARVALGAGIDGDLALGRVGVYDALEHAFRLAGRRLGLDPVTVQASTWIVARNGRPA